MEIDESASSIEVSGKAWGFIPADFVFKRFEADIRLDPAEEGAIAGGEFRFRYPELSSGRANRDKRIHDWLEAERYPEGSFRLERVERERDRFVAVGQLRLHGVSREARFEFELTRDGETARLQAVARIDYREWKLPTLRVLVFSVDPTLEIRIDVSGKLVPDE